MSAVATLQNELRNLGALSKRGNGELSRTCDEALATLDVARQSFSSDASVVNSLRQQRAFVTPLVLACSEASAKSCASALQCVQILAQYRGIAPARLHDLLQALMEATKLGLGIQLKILQVLPTLLYSFSSDLSDALVVELLAVCAELLGTNKVSMVHNAAYATLQQLITGVFDRIDAPDNLNSPDRELTVGEESFTVSAHLYDAAMILLDICDLAEREPPKFVRISQLSPMFTLELFELTLANQQAIFSHAALAAVLRLRITPLLLRTFVGETAFPMVLRVTRIFYLLLRRHLSTLTTESEVILSTLIQNTSRGPLWKQALSLEVLQSVCMEEDLLVHVYDLYDAQTRTSVVHLLVSELTSEFTHNTRFVLATEVSAVEYARACDPPAEPEEPAAEEHMILTRHSAQQPLIEILDRVDPPEVNEEYKYFLILRSLTSLVENVHKLVSSNSSVADLLPQVSSPLQVFHSMALGLAMDQELYKTLIRSAQRLAHSSGILGLKDLRDEFMRLIIQYCQVPHDSHQRPWLVQRCSLCVRALFTLGYALGNQLQESWTLIASAVLQLSRQIPATCEANAEHYFGTSDPEFATINMTLQRLVENTASLKTGALLHFMRAFSPVRAPIQFIVLERAALANAARVADPRTNCWPLLADLFLEGAQSGEYRVECSATLNAVALQMMATTCTSDTELTFDISAAHAMLLHTLCSEIDECNLTVKIGTINDLNALLEKYGGHIRSGWEDIFSSVSPIPSTNNIDLMRPAFHTLELITNDFLDSIPYTCVFSLTLCLDEFSRQLVDLNISFTSTSLLWHVCDHLMRGDAGSEDLNPKDLQSEEDLITLARDEHSRSKRSALWLLALLKLARIAELVPQQQVRSSALQIFLRLLAQNGAKLGPSVWDVAFKLVFPALLQACRQPRAHKEVSDEETLQIVIEGVSQLFTKFAAEFKQSTYFEGFWDQWIEFLDWAVKQSPKVASGAFDGLRELQSVPSYSGFASSVANFWQNQSPLPVYSEAHPKPTADSLQSLVKLYYKLASHCDDAKALRLIGKCAAFPYYTALVGQLSALQADCVSAIDLFFGKPEATADILELLSELSLTTFDASPNQNFRGLSDWALSKLEVIVDSDFHMTDAVLAKVPLVLKSMNLALRNGCPEPLPSKIFVKMFKLCPVDREIDFSGLTEAVQLLLSNNDESSLVLLSDFIAAMREKHSIKEGVIHEKTWEEVLWMLLEYSIFYERSTLNLNYYRDHTDELDAILQYGTVEMPKSLHRSRVACFCLTQLFQLSKGHESYAPTARKYYTLRARATLLQYIGDRKIQGREPMRQIIQEELFFVLKQLESDRDSAFAKLVADCIPRANVDVLPYLQRILR